MLLFYNFLHIDKHENLLKIDAMILMGKVKHSQSSQNSKFAMAIYNISKKVRNGVHFEHSDKHQSFYKLALLLLMEVARQKYHNCYAIVLQLCGTVMQNIQVFCQCLVMFADVYCFWVVVVKNGCRLLGHRTHVKNELTKWSDFLPGDTNYWVGMLKNGETF